MFKIVIVGGGFAGLSALNKLGALWREAKITLIDKKQTFDFLPLLPDVIGREVSPQFLTLNLNNIQHKFPSQFLNTSVIEIQREKKQIITSQAAVPYDYLILATGSETNFYGNNVIRSGSLTLDSVQDAMTIKEKVGNDDCKNYIVVGGGYTGIEIATNIRRCLDKQKKTADIYILEKSPSILGPLPQWMKDYAKENLKRMNIEVLLENGLVSIENGKATCEKGQCFEDALVVWTAGVKTGDYLKSLNVEQKAQGRVSVDEHLKIEETCYVVGDAAFNLHKEKPLRMGVQFSIAQGQVAAQNIINSIKGKPLVTYKPRDLGFVIPMANNFSCGNVLNVNSKGRFPTFLHYTMCLYRSAGFQNKAGLLKDLLNPQK